MNMDCTACFLRLLRPEPSYSRDIFLHRLHQTELATLESDLAQLRAEMWDELYLQFRTFKPVWEEPVASQSAEG